MRRKPVIQAELPKNARAVFQRKVKNGRRVGDCWLATQQPSTRRPAIAIGGVTLRAHQWAYAIYRGDIPAGRGVLHTCDVPRCVNPDHLWLGTQAQNIADMDAKGRRNTAAGRRSLNQRGAGNPNARLSEIEARELLNLRGAISTIEAGRRFGVSPNHVSNIWTGVRWSHLQQA